MTMSFYGTYIAHWCIILRAPSPNFNFNNSVSGNLGLILGWSSFCHVSTHRMSGLLECRPAMMRIHVLVIIPTAEMKKCKLWRRKYNSMVWSGVFPELSGQKSSIFLSIYFFLYTFFWEFCNLLNIHNILIWNPGSSTWSGYGINNNNDSFFCQCC